MQKRDRKIMICLTDDEFVHLDNLVATYSINGYRASKSFLVRYALKRLPVQQTLSFHNDPVQVSRYRGSKKPIFPRSTLRLK